MVRKEIICLLDAGVIYSILDCKWASPIHCIPKKGGVSLVTNENNDLVPTRAVIGYGMCVDFRKLNKWTKKDHYSLPFINEILQRLANNSYFCYLEGILTHF